MAGRHNLFKLISLLMSVSKKWSKELLRPKMNLVSQRRS